MNINLAPGNAGPTLSWVVPATNFVLQQSSDFINWSNVPTPTTFNSSNVQNQVTLPVSGANGFFRLRTP